MRNILALIGLLVVGVAGAGWYLGWYKLSFTREADGNLQIKTDVDTNKVSKDLKNLATAVENQADKATKDVSTAPPTGTPGATPGPVTPSHISTFNPLTPTTPETPTPSTNSPTPPRSPVQLFAPKQ